MNISITPQRLTSHIETVEIPNDTVDFFYRLSKNHNNAVLFESKETSLRFGNFSVGTSDPTLKLWGKGENFKIIALNAFGQHLLEDIAPRLKFCDSLVVKDDSIQGVLATCSHTTKGDELARLKTRNHTDILRVLCFSYPPVNPQEYPYGGLFGLFSYDFVDQFESLPPNTHDPLGLPDWIFYYVDNLFVIDQRIHKMHLVVNSIGLPAVDPSVITQYCSEKFANYKRALHSTTTLPDYHPNSIEVTTDTSQEEYVGMVTKMKENIKNGDVFQIVPSRTIIAKGGFRALNSYKELCKINPSPYMFFLNFGDHQLVGSSPEVALRVKGKKEKRVEIRPIAGTRPRGFKNSKIDPDLDSRYEVELLTNQKELSEHIMLVDLARNDIAKIADPGTRVVDEPLVVEKYSHVQHLVSNVSGILKGQLDAFHAYLATMNMGTITGAPKIEAMKLIRTLEKNKRGYYGGAVVYVSADGDLDSGLIIRSMVFKNDSAYLRVGAGVVHDSDPESEFKETQQKAHACFKVLEKNHE